jgi:hypothetical protein
MQGELEVIKAVSLSPHIAVRPGRHIEGIRLVIVEKGKGENRKEKKSLPLVCVLMRMR